MQILDRLMAIIDKVCKWCAVVAAGLVLPLIFIQVFEVVARYVFDSPTIWAFEMSKFTGGSVFVLGMAWALLIGAHIRVDILYNRMSPRKQALLDVVITVVLVFPALLLSAERMIEWTADAWAIKEVSSDTAWRVPIYPFITVMPISIIVLTLALFNTTVRDIRKLIGKREGV